MARFNSHSFQQMMFPQATSHGVSLSAVTPLDLFYHCVLNRFILFRTS
jgi:hypothetical protein